ncbi:sensor histidine kinase [Apibacter sp. HY039]|uniref:sensor histidine kinase n=1 Tax=Apibacter sp. HY039 TaxID=2501476 RepID=UPI000FEB5DBD|nr:sensor histidine kinase [Apibacter sp. HY039]
MSPILLSNFLKNILLEPSYKILRHLLLILFFFIIAFNAALFAFQDDLAMYHPPISLLIAWGTGFTLMYLLFAYSILYSMIPKYLIKKKYTTSIIFLLGGSILLTLIILLFEYIILNIYHIPLKSFSLNTARFPIIRLSFNFLILFVCFSSLPITALLKNWFINTKKVYNLEQIQLKKELEQLKGSINPDFLFEILDQASLLAIKNPSETSEIVLKLSKLLRYQLYEGSKEKVPLSSEIQFLSDFLTLIKLLYKEFHFKIESTENLFFMVPPLLYISLLEEYIKEIQKRKITSIYILLKKEETMLSFICKYKQTPNLNIKWNLDIVKQRLDLLYTHDEYELKSENNINEYGLRLDIRI